jgi:hypothetical protein
MANKWSIPPGQLEQSFARAARLHAELLTKERAIGRKVQVLAKCLADLMEPGTLFHRRGVSLHAFDVDRAVCLASAYLEGEGDHYRHRYAVLCGGEAAVRALRTVTLDPGDSDEPGPGRRVALATYPDFDDFIERPPAFLGDVTRDLEGKLQRAAGADAQVLKARRQMSALTKRRAREVGP